ncbi:MAG: hypothetical protein CL935_01095 [Deltaproteobacteria bacterium]|mgnify:CR=1 FL=1|nr:hypothetical protein [Deltaproteobacteria bacterium]|tara:strand:+ start:230 stop:433 length:204 start_codon:yes stop_codon:yes gene_type:complete
MNPKFNTKLNFEHLLIILEKIILQNSIAEKKDFYHLLEEISIKYNHSREELLMRGFRKAYRQIVDGV